MSGDASLSSRGVSPQLRRCVAGVRRCVAFVGDHDVALARRIGVIALDRKVPLVVPTLLPCNMQSTVNVADLEHLSMPKCRRLIGIGKGRFIIKFFRTEG